MNHDVFPYEIHRLFNDSDTQGRLVAIVEDTTYKFGPGNAARSFIRATHPDEGKYMAVGPMRKNTPTDRVSIIFEVRYADAVLITDGPPEPVGGSFGWARGGRGKVIWPPQIEENRA